jgi:hypothetical protein
MDTGGLPAGQNPDGGWGYAGGGSAVEPTAWALIALHAQSAADSESFRRGVNWLARLQRPDGGWPPRPGVSASTWVTALVALVPAAGLNSALAGARKSLLAQTGRESSLIERLRMALMGVRSDIDVSNNGWPWFPGAAAWVMPTSLTLLALRRLNGISPDREIPPRIQSGQQFLLARMCADGGWNHGSSKALGYDAGSYPETTGMALLALEGIPAQKLTRSFKTAERHLAETRSREAASWLQLGLAAHHQPVISKQFDHPPRNVQETALSCLADMAREGRNVLLMRG